MPKKIQNNKFSSNYHGLAGSERPPHPKTKRLGVAGVGEVITVTLIVRRRPGGPAIKSPADFQKAARAPSAKVSGQEFEEAHGATQADLDEVGQFCRAHNLTVLDANRSRRSVVARGTVAQVNAAFGVKLHHYESPIGKYHGYEGQIELPAALDGVVEAVVGLDNRPVPSRHLSADPTNTVPLTPQQVAQLYNFPAGTGAGQTIGIYEGPGAGYTPADLASTLNGWGITTAPTPTDFPPGSNSNVSDDETVLDITVAHAIANEAAIVVYFNTGTAAGDIISTLGSMIHPTGSDPVPTILSISYAWSADDDTSYITSSDYTQIDSLFSDAAQKGITVLVASGDTGAECESDTQAQVWFPGSDPWVLSCGGTTIGNIIGSNFDEYVWNDTFGINSGATGGGISARFPVPPWQDNINLPKRNTTGTAGRGTPDVAGNASPNSGYPLFAGGINQGPIGGTSAVAPLYAGLVALLNQNLGENVGFLNPTIYALGSSVCRDVTGAAGPPNNNFGGVTGYPAGVGWDACTGWGSIDGSALLANLQTLFEKSMTFIMQRSTFGQDEVASNDVFNQAFFITVDGLTPGDFPGGGITQLITTPTPSPAQLALLATWAPSIPNPVGPAGPTNITITPTAVSSDDPSLSPEVQLFTFTYAVTFPDLTAFTNPPTSDFPEVLTLTASLPVSTGVPPASTEIELITAADPFFSSESNGGLYWLSEDIRVFYAEEGSTLFGAPALGSTPAAAQSFIQWIIANISGPLGTGPNGDTFESLPASESSSLSLLPVATNPPHNAIFNFAIARVRLNGESEEAKQVRAFFRLFQSQSVAVPYQTPINPTGVSAPTGPYRQWSDGIEYGQKTPLLGISSDGSEYITVPCFASARVANTTTLNNMTTQTDPPNVQPMTPVPGETVYAYFGCWLDNNQSALVFPLAPGTNPDGPFTGTLNTVSQVLDRGGHQCIVVQIVDDEAPILDNATPGADKIAQRNLTFTVVANPGLADSRLATHTFEIRPSPFTFNADERPDELMIDWGNVPAGSVASIYLPAVQAADVLALAARMYTIHNLTASDAHTLQCETGGTTYIPIPKGSGPNYAGLFSVQLPLGIKHGQEFRIVVRQITSSFESLQATNPVKAQGRISPRERFVYGAFQIAIPVSTKSEMLIPEERDLSVLRWIQETIPVSSRWYLVFQRYIDQLSGRVTALGGNGSTVPPTQTGIWPGLLGPGKGKPTGTGTAPHDRSFTGKVDGLVYDHFGDFEAFVLETFGGERHRFDSHEPSVRALVQRAWAHRILTTVIVRHDHPERPIEIILHGAPPPSEE
ncbi:MAG: protease pro-enzyme activation domain-containing protein [Candidatus Binataceae bacterium]